MRRNVQIVLEVYRAIAAKDANEIAALCDPAIEVRQSEELPWGGVYHGLEQSMGFFHHVSSVLDSQVSPETMLDAGDYVAVVGRTEGTVRLSGQMFSVPLVHLWGLKNGRVTSLQVVLDNPSMIAALDGDAHSPSQPAFAEERSL